MIRIVIISQHIQESEILQMAFKQKGFAIYTSRSNQVNYLQLLQFNPDFVLLEIPEAYHDQLALLRTLRKNERFSKTPVIAFGSVDESTLISDIKNGGCSEFIKRPIKMNRLYEIMRKASPEADLESESKKIEQTREQEKLTDLQRLLDLKETPSVKIDLMVKHVGKLLSFPFAIAKILEITDDPNRGADDLATVINGDPSLSTTILKVSNSVHFATSAKEIRSPKDAIMRLGFNEVKSIAMGLGLMELFPAKETFGFQRMDFWTYALGRGLISEKLAKHARYPDAPLAFLAGLLADFAVLIFDAAFPDVFEATIKKIAQDGCSFDVAAESVLGFFPSTFISKLLEQWRLPRDLIECARLQSKFFERPEENQPGATKILADAVALSGVLVRSGNIGQGLDDVLQIPPDSVLRELGIPSGVTTSFYDYIGAGLNMYASFFGIDRKLLPKPILEQSQLKPALYIRLGKIALDPYFLLLSRDWKFTPAHDAASVAKAIQIANYKLVVLHCIDETHANEANDFFSTLANLKDPEGKPVGVLGIWPNSLPTPTPSNLRFGCIHQQGDLRKLTLLMETIVQV